MCKNTLTWIARIRTGCRRSAARRGTRTPRPRRLASVFPSPVSRRFARHVRPADGPTVVACTARAEPPPRPFPFSPSFPRPSVHGTSPSPNPNRAKTDGPAWKVRSLRLPSDMYNKLYYTEYTAWSAYSRTNSRAPPSPPSPPLQLFAYIYIYMYLHIYGIYIRSVYDTRKIHQLQILRTVQRCIHIF